MENQSTPIPANLEPRLIGMVESLATSKGLAVQSIDPATTFESLQMDSLDRINLLFDVEEAFHISIPDSSIASLRTVGDMIEGVRTLLSARPS